MPITETHIGPTPNGGVKSQIIYLKGGRAVEKDEADSAEIIEFDASGKAIHRTYMTKSKTASIPQAKPQPNQASVGAEHQQSAPMSIEDFCIAECNGDLESALIAAELLHQSIVITPKSPQTVTNRTPTIPLVQGSRSDMENRAMEIVKKWKAKKTT